VASRYLATGYWRHAERAAEPFEADAGDPAVRRFRTGDLGRFRPDGSLEILGRRDAELGGDSLKAAALVARVLGRFGVALSAPGLLASSTIEEMALRVVESLAAAVGGGDGPPGPGSLS